MKNKNYLLKSLFIVFISLLIIGCDSNDVSLVKNGTLNFDKSLTVGEAFDNYKYFKDVKWESFETDNGRKVVQVTGILDIDKLKQNSKEDKSALEQYLKAGVNQIDIIFQFLILKDEKSFNINTEALKLHMKNGTVKTLDANQLNLRVDDVLYDLKKIYNNKSLL